MNTYTAQWCKVLSDRTKWVLSFNTTTILQKVWLSIFFSICGFCGAITLESLLRTGWNFVERSRAKAKLADLFSQSLEFMWSWKKGFSWVRSTATVHTDSLVTVTFFFSCFSKFDWPGCTNSIFTDRISHGWYRTAEDHTVISSTIYSGVLSYWHCFHISVYYHR